MSLLLYLIISNFVQMFVTHQRIREHSQPAVRQNGPNLFWGMTSKRFENRDLSPSFLIDFLQFIFLYVLERFLSRQPFFIYLSSLTVWSKGPTCRKSSYRLCILFKLASVRVNYNFIHNKCTNTEYIFLPRTPMCLISIYCLINISNDMDAGRIWCLCKLKWMYLFIR